MLHSQQTSSTLRLARNAAPALPTRPLLRNTIKQPHTVVRAAEKEEDPSTSRRSPSPGPDAAKIERELKKTAATFAPRSSTAKGKNPAVKGTALYDVFEYQAWIALAAGGLLSFNIMFPSDEPSIARLMGMWSIWMFTIPSLRAKDCSPREKDALNLLFVLVPLMNVLLPFVWKSFAFIFTADVVALVGMYYWKGAFMEVYGLPFYAPGSMDPKPQAAQAGEQPQQQGQEQQQPQESAPESQ